MLRTRTAVCLLIVAIQPLLASFAAQADLFDVQEIPMKGRSVAAELADFNGDGRVDLMAVSLVGLPPNELRTIHVYLQSEEGALSASPNHELLVPEWSAVYDVADVKETPGEELVLLRPDGVTILSIGAADGPSWHLPVAGPSTIGAADDERGFEPFPMVFDDIGEEPWILVPQVGRMTAIDASGKIRAALNVGRRANYFVIPDSGPLSVETDIQLFLDVPKLAVGDINRDGKADFLTSTRHELRVFLQKADGIFASDADRTIPLNLVTPRDHIRGSGGVATLAKDIDGDGALDLLLSHVEGSLTDANTTTSIYMNRDGGWNLDKPDSLFAEEASLGSDILVDLDSDGRLELLRIRLEFGLLELVELLLTQEIDASVSIHRLQDDGSFSKKAWSKRQISLGFSFDTFRTKGFVPPIGIDLNQDGFVDLLRSGDGDVIDIYLGGDSAPYKRRSARQKMVTAGVVHFEEFNGDGLPDFVLFDPHSFDTPIRVAINRGELEGTPPRLTNR